MAFETESYSGGKVPAEQAVFLRVSRRNDVTPMISNDKGWHSVKMKKDWIQICPKKLKLTNPELGFGFILEN
jgi:hypothetical protein